MVTLVDSLLTFLEFCDVKVFTDRTYRAVIFGPLLFLVFVDNFHKVQNILTQYFYSMIQALSIFKKMQKHFPKFLAVN